MVVIVEHIETPIVNDGKRSGLACELMATLAQKGSSRDAINACVGQRLLRAILELLKPEAEVASLARSQVKWRWPHFHSPPGVIFAF